MYWNHSQPPKKTRNQMNVPYYILVNDKIAKERNIPYYNLKIVRVTKCNTLTFKKIKNGELEEINFESVWE